jgi:hypothetical protein
MMTVITLVTIWGNLVAIYAMAAVATAAMMKGAETT